MEIERWWPEMDLPAKEWLRENLRTEPIPDHVLAAVKSAGGAVVNGALTRGEWDFIETQSEFVD